MSDTPASTDNVSASATLTADPAAANATSTAPEGSSTTTATTTPWFDAADADTKSFVENKGWKEPKDVLKSYRELEKLLGQDKAGKTFALPDWNDKAQVDALYEKLGRPANPDQYELQLGDNPDQEFVAFSKNAFHELGLNASQAKALSEKWAQFGAQRIAAEHQATQAKAAQEAKVLDQEWGAAKDSNVRVAQQAVRQLGFDAKAVDALQTALGYDGVMKFMHSLGTKLGESSFVAGDRSAGEQTLTLAQRMYPTMQK